MAKEKDYSSKWTPHTEMVSICLWG